MDIYSLAITHIHAPVPTVRMSAWAEDRYYSDHKGVPRFRPGLFGSVAMAAGMIMILGMTLI
ncbi:hypothetical protein G6M86_28780 (plasmid) [Agrobacterium tumefaciens]|uniref:Uncharacterized protein n=1 Tax=Agrobacterium tumefaciens TaxID=358 RepID=A0AAJ4TDI7_AGRTU|nr:hypothetical protein G6M86_28780 [Agrobacterium tumefaciens]